MGNKAVDQSDAGGGDESDGEGGLAAMAQEWAGQGQACRRSDRCKMLKGWRQLLYSMRMLIMIYLWGVLSCVVDCIVYNV